MPQILFLADDLTGAAEVAAGAAISGMPSRLYHRPDGWATSVPGAVTLDLATRHRPPEVAARAVHAAVQGLRPSTVIYKKSDSTLRGNVAVEVAALAEAEPGAPLLYFPAAPGKGRTVRDGQLLVEGIPLGQTAFARDPLAPVSTGDLPRLLRTATRRDVRSVSVAEVAAGTPDLQDPGKLFVFDAVTFADLEAAGRLAREQGVLRCLGGAGDFPVLLPGLLGFAGRPPVPVTLPRPRLVVNGSLHPSALAQIAASEAAGNRVVGLSAASLFGGIGLDRVEPLAAHLEREEDLVLCTARSPAEAAAYQSAAAAAGVPAEGFARSLTDRLARTAADLLGRCSRPISLVTFGGELTEACWLALQADSAEVLGEALPQVYAMRASARGRVWLWASKPGGFGGADLLVRLLG